MGHSLGNALSWVLLDDKGYAIFDNFSVYDTRLNISEFREASYIEQMRMATRDLVNAINKGYVNKNKFTPSQLNAIYKGESKIPNFTWHHQDTGRMQLVDYDLHKETSHIGWESMENKFRLTRDSSEDIGFVKSCFIKGAITNREFNDWVEYVIVNDKVDDLPLYIFDLIDFNGSFYELINIIGFTPDPILTEDEDNAIYGIAIKRFGNDLDIPISNNEALRALDRNPLISKRFKSIFPFINFSY